MGLKAHVSSALLVGIWIAEIRQIEGEFVEKRPAGDEAHVYLGQVSARLKSCPFKTAIYL